MNRPRFSLFCSLSILLLAGCSGNTSSGGPPPSVTVTVTPSAPTVNLFGRQQFSAMVTGSSNTAVTWEVNGTAGGSQQFGFISSSGLYVAPSGVPTKADSMGGVTDTTLTVTAVAQANSADSNFATVTLMPDNRNAQTASVKLGTTGGNASDSSTSGTTITCCAGTLGSLIAVNGTQYILSNNHVLARSDQASLGESIIQPGLVDVNCNKLQGTSVATLSQFYNLETGPLPKIDAAIAQVVPGVVDSSGNILYLGATADGSGVPLPGAPHGGPGVAATIGMTVAKSGRTTGLTCSSVFSVSTNTSVQYMRGCGTGTTFSVTYQNQVDISGGSFTAEGDSGSLVVTQNTADPVALFYAGSSADSVGNPVSDVLGFFASGGKTAAFVGGAAHQVIGCTLPVKPASTVMTEQATATSTEALQKAITVRDAHAPELLAHPEVQAVGVGGSYDSAGEPAILFFVTKGQPRTGIPAQVDGIRTRVIEGDLFLQRGAVSIDDSGALEKTVPPPQFVYAVSDAEVARAKIVHTAHADELMKQPGVQGVGIGSSMDSPGEAALIIFLIRGAAHNSIPPVIDGLRTRVRESTRFRAGFGDKRPRAGCSVASTRNGQVNASQNKPSKSASN